ncbi:MAG: hypothetical protein EKK55_16385 [Rhodocyclaceae bacterium]|nr:MAG: hypothetical protein EKK55_16385 [Rhodocyclaceae bacterium]
MTPHTRLPLLWFMPPVDLRDLAGVVIFHRGGGGNVTLPSYDVDLDEGIYEDAIAFANGRGSTADAASVNNRRDLTSDWQAQHPDGYGEGGVRITADNKVQLWCTAAFDLEASADNAVYGLPTAGATSVLDLGGEYRITATDDWQRGPVEDARITIDPGVDPDFTIPRYATVAQSVVELVRRRGRTLADDGGDYEAGDYDGDDNHAADCLEALDNAVNDATLRRIRWYIDTTGHLCSSWPTSLSLAAPTFDSATFRARIGASGNLAADSQVDEDTVTTVGDATVWRAARPMPGVLCTTRPWIRRPRRIRGERTDAERLIDGGAASHGISAWEDLEFEFWIDGPESPHTEDDLSAHWGRQVLRYAPQGAPITVYMGQDTRRHLEVDQVSEDVPGFSDLYSVDPCGGRWYGWVRSVDDEAVVTLEFDDDQQGGQFWARATLRISPPEE